MNRFHTWNIRPEDESRTYACDALAFQHDDVYFRAIDVAADARRTFRWLCQLRVAPYSYDLIDNFGRTSPRTLTPGLEHLVRGQSVMTIFELVSFEHPYQITARLRSRLARALMGDFAGTYAVVPTLAGVRIVVKILVRYPRGPFGRLLRIVMPALDLFMFRKQLTTLRDRIEAMPQDFPDRPDHFSSS